MSHAFIFILNNNQQNHKITHTQKKTSQEFPKNVKKEYIQWKKRVQFYYKVIPVMASTYKSWQQMITNEKTKDQKSKRHFL